MIVRGRPHLENQFITVHDLFVADISFIEWLAVQRRALKIYQADIWPVSSTEASGVA